MARANGFAWMPPAANQAIRLSTIPAIRVLFNATSPAWRSFTQQDELIPLH